MLFGHHVVERTIDEHVREIADLASDRQTLIFLDTNVLTYLYKLHGAARREFFQWSDAVAAKGRLFVPAWAASEYLAGVTSRTLDSYTPKGKEADQARKLLDGLLKTASLFVDDAVLRRISFAEDRAVFLTRFRNAIDALTPFMNVFSQAFEPGAIHQEIDQHLSACVLASDLPALCVRATQEGVGRFEHRLPPGFRDGAKLENGLGDLIIWFEILEKAAASAEQFPKVLFISRDEKDDWVYAPKMRMQFVRGERKVVGNTRPEIRLADPRLVAEFSRRVGHTSFAIASLNLLVEGLSRSDPGFFAELAAAIQITTENAARAAESPATAPPAEEDQSDAIGSRPPADAGPDPADEPPAAEAPVERPPEPALDDPPPIPRLQYDREALEDREYQADAPSEINDIIRALKSHNWYTQNPAFAKVRALRGRTDFDASSWFVLGRNIYQAACGNSQKAMEFIAALEAQLRQFEPDRAQHVLAGMLFEVYFDSKGEYRSIAKFSYADKLLAVVTKPEFADALQFIIFHLHPQRGRLKFQPGDTGRLAIRIVSVPLAAQPAAETEPSLTFSERAPTHELQSVLLDGAELLRDVVGEEENEWYRLLSGNRLSAERIRERVSDDLAIPKWALTLDLQPLVKVNEELAVPEGKDFDPRLAIEALPRPA